MVGLVTKKEPVLFINNVSVSYGKVRAIRDIGLSVPTGQFFGLMGLNGAGKTTLIKSILGLRTQQIGEISLFGNPCTDAKSKKSLAYLPERFEPPWFLTGLEFLRFSVQLYQKNIDDTVFFENAEKLALDPLALRRRVDTYSKGMRQKLGLLGTVLTGCRFLILDEPMSGLDPVARTLVKDMLLEIKTQERTIFLSSHILSDMDEICDQVCLLHEGTIHFTGKPQDMKAKAGVENLERAFLHFIEKKEVA